eukprot:gb/GECH01009739.1/.p1 GENE.gb/GECH01009739.1/~~gb/GECH01009739.1/.p1  ORF type:complete len:175 (+),score=48.04 gb/GECH01009739.1/:1-525(+)
MPTLAQIKKQERNKYYENESSVKFLEGEQYTLQKRTPEHASALENEIYVSRKTPFPALFKRAVKLLDSEQYKNKGIVIRGMGAAIERSVNLAIELQSYYGNLLRIAPSTSTTQLIDDFIPLEPELETETQIRFNSSIKIMITRIPVTEIADISPKQNKNHSRFRKHRKKNKTSK